MEKKQTVAEYCADNRCSPQAVYARIKRGTLNAVKENGITLIVNDETTVQQTQIQDEVNAEHNAVTTLMQSIINDQKKEIKRLHKTIKQLQGQVHKDMDLLLNILSGDTKPIQIAAKATKDDVIDLEEVKTAKKASKRKKGKKKKKK